MTIDYDYTVEKINKDGNAVLSNQLHSGEKLSNGQTYAQEQKRLSDFVPESSPFAQGSLSEHNKPENPVPALTLSDDGVNTKRADDVDPEPRESAPVEPDLIATVSEDGSSTIIVSPEDDEEADEDAPEEDEPVDPPVEEPADDETPQASDSKQAWYDYATEHKGLTVAYEDITKNEIIAFVGEQQ